VEQKLQILESCLGYMTKAKTNQMDYAKIQSLLDEGIAINLEDADEHSLQYSFDNFRTRYELTPGKYKTEEKIAAIINASVKRINKG